MSPKQLRNVAIVLGVVVLLWGASELLSRGSDDTSGDPVLPTFTQAEVDSVQLSNAEGTVRLAKAPDGGWTVNGFRASPNLIEDFFKTTTTQATPTLAAENPELHSRMGVDSASGKFLRIVGGGATMVDLIIGGRGRDYVSSFVRRPGDNRVFLHPARLAGYLDRNVDDWRDPRMATITPENVAQVDITRRRGGYTLVRKDGVWQFANDSPLDTAAVRRLLNRFNPLNATGFATPEQADSADFRRPDIRVVLRGPAGDTLTDLVFDSTSTGYFVRERKEETIYRTGVWVADEVAPADTTLMPKG